MNSIKSKDCLFKIIGSAGGLGLLPFIPGSFGSLVGVGIHLSAWYLAKDWFVTYLLIFLILVSFANHLLTPWAVSYWKSRDPKQFVLDEVAGYLLVPILFRGSGLIGTVLWGFVLFRILDAIKIPPAKQIDRNIHNAWGILFDDFVSATYASIIMYILRFWSHNQGLSIGL